MIRALTAMVAFVLIFVCQASDASARHYHGLHHYRHHAQHHRHYFYDHPRHYRYASRHRHRGGKVVSYLPHPSGCPRVAFCGCGAYKAITGQVVPRGTWALANYWPGHYHGSTPVAWWRGHVAVVRQFLGNGMALVEDYNSGGHQSRLHVRDIRHARILGGGRYAQL